ncbi:MAG: NAD(P)/FAD-dependent oxidoreductase [Halobacteriaceae archaeon]
MKVAVVGAGAVGATAAMTLANAGHEVTVYEAATVGSGATGRAAGLAYAAYVDPLDARIGERSLAEFRTAGTRGTGFNFTPRPYLWFATDRGETADAIRRQVDRMQRYGVDVELLDSAAVAARYPGLRTEDITVAALARNAGFGSPAAYAADMAATAEASGATIHERTPVSLHARNGAIGIDGSGATYDRVAVAAGAHTGRLVANVTEALPMAPYRVQALVGEYPTADLPMLFDATAGVYARPHPDGLLIGDGTEERPVDPSNWKETADAGFVETAREFARQRLAETLSVARSWAGLCTATPDGEPLLGRAASGLTVATGWQGHGFMRAPETGRLLATATIEDRSPIGRFDPRRVPGDTEFDVVEGMIVD